MEKNTEDDLILKAREVNYERQVVNIPTESQSSIEIKRCTKGTTFAVKVYDVDPNVATKKAVVIYNKLNEQYPQVVA